MYDQIILVFSPLILFSFASVSYINNECLILITAGETKIVQS